MTTVGQFSRSELKKSNTLLSPIKVTVESAFYGNNVREIPDLTTAYNLAKEAKNTIVTDLPVAHTKELGLPDDAKVLVSNDGKIFGRTAKARRIIGEPGVDENYYAGILREAIFNGQDKTFYKGTTIVGLSEDFSVKAHLCLAEGYENNFYSWMLNFQVLTEEVNKEYEKSAPLAENDLYLYANPDWRHPDFPDGLALFDPKHNVAAILGLRYFGELKKATLTLAWATAHRNNFVACHGGMKQYDLGDKKFTMAAFGLSGSGKSTITLAKHQDVDIPVKVLHDDAFVINKNSGSTTALEPSYFDKTQDYPMDSDAVKYFLTVQNVGVTLDHNNQKVLVTEDIRNGNGRTVKSRYLTENRVDFLPEKIDAIFWIMKDDSLPPLVKISDPDLATLFGVTLATKRSTAENVSGNLDQLVMEPFANPFRSYPLGEDYSAFKDLFNQGVACYILNTGFFNGRKVTPKDTLGAIDAIIKNTAEFKDFGPVKRLSYLPLENHPVDFHDVGYLNKIKERLVARLSFINEKKQDSNGYHALPKEANELMESLILDLAQKISEE